jgi:hypothetical protein
MLIGGKRFWLSYFWILDSKNRIFREKSKHLPYEMRNYLANDLLSIPAEIQHC